jgi:GNAT superfamily N-acetyltransferase
MPATEVVTIADRPDLAPTVADWIYHEWGKHDGYSFEQTLEYISAAGNPIPTTFVLLADGVPVGTSSLVAHDLDERPNLTPWLAGVFVAPEQRRKGYVIQLIQAVEAAAIAASVRTLWLHTVHARRIYAKGGWEPIEVVQRQGKPPVTLMRRDFMPGM